MRPVIYECVDDVTARVFVQVCVISHRSESYHTRLGDVKYARVTSHMNNKSFHKGVSRITHTRMGDIKYAWVTSHMIISYFTQDLWHVFVSTFIVCCSVLQCVAVCCSVCSVLQCVAVCCSVLQCAAVCCSVLQCVAVYCSVLQCVAMCCSMLQCGAARCNVLQCAAVCCSDSHICDTIHLLAHMCYRSHVTHQCIIARAFPLSAHGRVDYSIIRIFLLLLLFPAKLATCLQVTTHQTVWGAEKKMLQ